MIQPKISIIVPIHNSGNYLNKCLTSLISQTLQELEIILVLDNPTDGSDKVAEEFAKRDSRIVILYNEENLHTGLSRNKGISIASGEYIGFMDHDDFCEPSMYEKLYNKAKEKDLDVVRCDFFCVYTDKGIVKTDPYVYPENTYDVYDKEWVYERVSNNTVSCVIWNHIYRKSFLTDNGIQFLDSRSICSEDSVFFLEVYHKVGRFATIEDCLYYHVFHNNNTGKVYEYRSISNRIAFFNTIYSLLIENDIEESIAKHYISQNALRSLYSGSHQVLKLYPFKKALKEIQAIRHNTVMMECIDYMYSKENRNQLFQLKPTIIIFFFVFRMLYQK